MIRAFPGGLDSIAPAIGMTPDGLENRIYERKGQGLRIDTAMQLQKTSGTTHFAQAIATASGGTFVQLPAAGDIDNDCIQSKFNETYAEIGTIFATFTDAVKDGVIDRKERRKLELLGEDLHTKTEELLGLMFSVYCPKAKEVKITARDVGGIDG